MVLVPSLIALHERSKNVAGRGWWWETGWGMHILRSTKVLDWGDLSLPVWGLEADWYGAKREKALMFSLADDGERLWFVAAGSEPARLHPMARPGAFVAELWKFDVAEFFIADAVSGRYIELNLAANGAWWSAEFTGPRVRAEAGDLAFPEVMTYADLSPDGGWMVAMSLPLDVLRARVNYGESSHINVAFIADSPQQRFYSATKLLGEQPDFHQPESFSAVTFTEWTE